MTPHEPGANQQRLLLWGPVILYMALIFGLSSIHNPPSPPSGISDKDEHMVLYAGLSFLIVRATTGGFRRRVSARDLVIAVAACALYGASDEFHQHFVPPREMDALDLAADAAGSAVAALALYLWAIIRGRHVL